MSTISDDPTESLASRLRSEREARGWSLADLAERAQVSKAMLSRIERAESSPTASLLGRISGAFGLTISQILAPQEEQGRRLRRWAEQEIWRDPATGYLRRQVSPACDSPIDLVHVELPPGQAIAYPAASYAFIRQMIWAQSGELTFVEGGVTHLLGPGDCLSLGPPADCVFRNDGVDSCRYLVVVARR
jgi:transcriptional regulator with XRE-family HTH domain